MRIRRQAFALIVALFMVTFISVMAFAFLSSGSTGYNLALKAVFESQAQQLAHSGIEDARIKLERDPDFPPRLGDEGDIYTYSEELRGLGAGAVVGTFDVTIDQTYAEAPFFLLRITSTGRIVRPGSEVKKTVKAEIDIRQNDRRAGHSGEANPNLYRIVNWSEGEL